MIQETRPRVIKNDDGTVTIDAMGVYYRQLNETLRELVAAGATKIKIKNVYGQRYIGTNLNARVEISVHGVPGSDLGAFMNGPRILVYGNGQDGVANTMNDGEIVINGHAGDLLGMSMRGGRVFVRDGVGYRCAIHIKEYGEKIPEIVIGGTAQDFFGEYMAGGRVLLLGLDLPENGKHQMRYLGTGMHGGKIFIRGRFDDSLVGKEVGIAEPDENDWATIERLVEDYAGRFDLDPDQILDSSFYKVFPKHLRPYGKLYAY